jgi:hypothetical protein
MPGRGTTSAAVHLRRSPVRERLHESVQIRTCCGTSLLYSPGDPQKSSDVAVLPAALRRSQHPAPRTVSVLIPDAATVSAAPGRTRARGVRSVPPDGPYLLHVRASADVALASPLAELGLHHPRCPCCHGKLSGSFASVDSAACTCRSFCSLPLTPTTSCLSRAGSHRHRQVLRPARRRCPLRSVSGRRQRARACTPAFRCSEPRGVHWTAGK